MSDRGEKRSIDVAEGPSTSSQICPFKKLYPSLLGQLLAEAFPLDRLRVELVSKQFECAARRFGWTAQNARRISWKTMVQSRREMETIKKFRITNEHIVALLRRVGPFLRELDLGSFKTRFDGPFFVAVFRFTPNITVLNLKHMELTASDLDVIAEHLSPKLKEIHFRDSFSVEAIRCFFTACTKLEVIRFSNALNACLDTLPFKLRSLEVKSGMTYGLIVTIDDRCAAHLEMLILYRVLGTNLQDVLPKFTKLKNLQISEFEKSEGKNILSPSCFGPALQHLKIRRTDSFNDECLRSITNGCQSIRTLELEICYSLTVESLQTLAKLSNLVDLKFSFVYAVSDDVLKAIARRGKLEALELKCLDEITDDSIRELVKWCKNLKSLTIRSCEQIIDDGLRLLTELPKLSNLRLVSQLSDQTLKAISRKGILKKLSVKYCQCISDESIIEVIACCKSLVELDVSYCPQVSDRSLDVLNTEMERRHGASTEPSTRREIEKRRFWFYFWSSGVTHEAMKNARKWINFCY